MNSVQTHPYPRLRGVIFDLDGTLVDSGLDFAAIRNELDCPPGVGVLEYIDSMPSEQARQRAHQVVLRHEMAGAERATLIAGADQLLVQLQQRGMPCAIVTRNARAVAELTLDKLGLQVDRLLAREDCAPKPSPQGLLKIAEDWQLPVAELLYVGDFLYDLQAARNAGMLACLYDPQGNSRYREQADWVIAALLDIIPD